MKTFILLGKVHYMAFAVFLAMFAFTVSCGSLNKQKEVPKAAVQNENKLDDTTKQVWRVGFNVVEIPSSKDGKLGLYCKIPPENR